MAIGRNIFRYLYLKNLLSVKKIEILVQFCEILTFENAETNPEATFSLVQHVDSLWSAILRTCLTMCATETTEACLFPSLGFELSK